MKLESKTKEFLRKAKEDGTIKYLTKKELEFNKYLSSQMLRPKTKRAPYPDNIYMELIAA